MATASTKPVVRVAIALVHAACVAQLVGLAACAGDAGPHGTFVVSEGGQALDAIPWPSDLLRDASGHIAIDRLPLDDTALTPHLLADLATEQDGFGVITGAYFPIGELRRKAFGAVEVDEAAGRVDAATLDGNVRLLPLRCGQDPVSAAEELPVYVHLRAQDRPQRIYARPQQGVVLKERCSYAYLVTSGVKTDRGALSAASDLRALLREEAPEQRLTRAHEIFAPLRAALALPRPEGARPLPAIDEIASATVFTTHSLTRDYLAARAALVAAGRPLAQVSRIYARTPTAADDGSLEELFGSPAVEQPGSDNPGGIAHAAIDYVIHGSYETADYLGGAVFNPVTGVETTAIGLVERSGDAPRIKGSVRVPFSIVIPAGADLARLRFAIVQHGLGGERGSMFTVANTLAGRGVASIVIDLPFHGGRGASAGDSKHRFTGAAGPDGLADDGSDASLGFFATAGNPQAGLPGVHPAAIRAAFFQSTLDILQAFRLMAEGDLSAIGAREPRLATLQIDATREAYVGESFGAMIGTIVSAFEPRLEAAVLDVGGGGTLFPLLLNSPSYAPVFGILLNGSLGAHAGETDDPRDTDWGYNLAAMMLEAGDALALSPYVLAAQTWPVTSEPDRACSVLQLSAYQDESVPNPANLALARGLGLQPLGLADAAPPDLRGWPGVEYTHGSLAGNAQGRTAAFIQFHDATHGMMTVRAGARRFDLDAGGPPFTQRAMPVMITNPIDRIAGLVGGFVAAALAGEVPKVE
jgi:hypothetical protein